MKTQVLTKSSVFIIGPVATLLGFVINALYLFLNGALNIQNISICIILFTIVVNVLMLPLTIKQQKSSKLTQVMNPELQAIQKKYKNKKDQASMMKMQEEQQAVYAKYGVSPMGQCLPLLIQMPILFAMYQVIWKIPAYVKSVYDIYGGIVDKAMGSTEIQTFLTDFAQQARINPDKLVFTNDSVVDILHSFTPDNWALFAEKFPDLKDIITSTSAQAAHINKFIGINITDAPIAIIKDGFSSHAVLPIVVAVAIPVLAGLTQYLNTKLIPTPEQTDDTSAVASSMKTMNTTMPLMSMFFCFTFSTGIGIYWVASSAVRCVIQLIINKRMENLDMEEMIKANVEKYNEKRVKQGLRPENISGQAKKNLKNLQNPPAEEDEAVIKEKNEKRLASMKESTEYYNKTAKPGSIASKARMVEQYNEKTSKDRSAYKK